MRYRNILCVCVFTLLLIFVGCSKVEDFRGRALDAEVPVAGNSGAISVSSFSTTNVSLSWSKASDNVSVGEQLSYCVYYSVASNIATVAEAEVNGTPFGGYQANINSQSVTGLQHSTSYYFTVVVKDEAGNKTIYRSVSKTTLEGVAPVVVVENVRNNSTIFSGFIIGTAADSSGLERVEVSLDGGTYQLASGTSSWTFKLPTGANIWKRGSLHTVRVRARDNVGNYSFVHSFTVRKGRNKDFNGDGYADLVVGGYLYNSEQGRVYLFYGKKAGISSTAASSADVTLTGEASSWFGFSVASGDLNGDGYADLAVGAFVYNSVQGRVYLFYGGIAGLSSGAATSADAILTGESGSRFGRSITIADVNGDGYEDLISGGYSYNGDQGRVYLFHGSSSGISSTTASSANTILTGEASSRFGYSVLAVDLNKDGIAEIVVGAVTYNSNSGRVYIFSGSSSGIASMSAVSSSKILDGEAYSYLGSASSFGDINGDGYFELAIGAYSYGSSDGRCYIFSGSVSGIVGTGGVNAFSKLSGESGSWFGYSAVCTDINCDGYADLIVGAIQFNNKQGRAYLFYGTGAGISSMNASSADAIFTGEAGSFLGHAVDVTDINGDGYPDLLLGAPLYDTLKGRAYIIYGSSSSISSMSVGSASVIITGESMSRFGTSVM